MKTGADVVSQLTKIETDEQKIRQLEEALRRARDDLNEYIAAEEVLVAAGLVAKSRIDLAHEIVRKLK